ncbi:cuticle protein 6-like [Amphibalanus amphitrite]|uniref:cuticle protein 6-like n=1 Tax=Amphibalanus amphitrite TaxID=1232801 RepID=UPI001C915374|nr:cuticle protein 6-like [Amphibalanus amphitrite]
MKSIFVVSLLVAVAASQEILSYDAGDHQHTASGEPGTSVSGEYSLQTPEGKTIVIKYKADENGYVAESDDLPQAPAVPDVPDVPAVPEVKAAVEEPAAEEPKPVPAVYAFNPYHYGLPYAALPYSALPCAAAPLHYNFAPLPYAFAPLPVEH